MDLRTVVTTLPTPDANAGARGSRHPDIQRANRNTVTINDVTERELSGIDFGKYQAAVDRWAAVIGREAPAPTNIGKNGGRRLAPQFAEWMMGLPAGWVTEPDLGISRTAQLRLIGNGVVPQQAHAALRELFDEEGLFT